MYSTYEQYKQRGGLMTESAYSAAALRAAEWIDAATMGRAESCTEMRDKLAACECELAELAAMGPEAAVLSSETTDGYSRTWLDHAGRIAAQAEILSRYLTFPVNLLVITGREGGCWRC